MITTRYAQFFQGQVFYLTERSRVFNIRYYDASLNEVVWSADITMNYRGAMNIGNLDYEGKSKKLSKAILDNLSDDGIL